MQRLPSFWCGYGRSVSVLDSRGLLALLQISVSFWVGLREGLSKILKFVKRFMRAAIQNARMENLCKPRSTFRLVVTSRFFYCLFRGCAFPLVVLFHVWQPLSTAAAGTGTAYHWQRFPAYCTSAICVMVGFLASQTALGDHCLKIVLQRIAHNKQVQNNKIMYCKMDVQTWCKLLGVHSAVSVCRFCCSIPL